MVICLRKSDKSGWVFLDVAVALSLLLIGILPLAYSFSRETKLCRIYYWQAVATEIVDGEFESLRSGEWKKYEAGIHSLPINAAAATNLPPGNFTLTVQTNLLRLEWIPVKSHQGGKIVREIAL